MKIISVIPVNAVSVYTDEVSHFRYTRYSATHWTQVIMGESDEQVYDCEKLEAAYQLFVANNSL